MIRLSNSISRCLSAALLIALLPGSFLLAKEPVRGPLPESQHDLIHQLARSHDKIQRQVTLTETGYEATTTSSDPEIAAALRAHVAYMQKRLAAGSMVRRWDPAYVEMVAHHKDLALEVVELPNGLKVTMEGATQMKRRLPKFGEIARAAIIGGLAGAVLTGCAKETRESGMRDAGLVVDEKRGYFVHYRLNEKALAGWKEAVGKLLDPKSRPGETRKRAETCANGN